MENFITKITDKDFDMEYDNLIKPELRIAARGIVIRDDGKIAIFNKKNKNEYKLPGGGVEDKETTEEAFYREIKEETGCDVKIIKKLGLTEENKFVNNFKQISHVYVGKVEKKHSNLI